MKRTVPIALTLLLFILISACTPVTPATQDAAPSNAWVSPESYHPLTTRTGNAEIDNVLDAVASGDARQLRALVQFTNAPCTQREGLGGPPKCREGESEGTLVDVLPFIGSEGSFFRKDEIGNWQGVDATGLYAVYEVSPAVTAEQYYPLGKYAIVLVGSDQQSPVVLRVDQGRIVRVDSLFVDSLQSLKAAVQREAGTVILPPLE